MRIGTLTNQIGQKTKYESTESVDSIANSSTANHCIAVYIINDLGWGWRKLRKRNSGALLQGKINFKRPSTGKINFKRPSIGKNNFQKAFLRKN